MSTWLRQLDVDTLIVAGETTSGCVRASVADADSHGFAVVGPPGMPENCVGELEDAFEATLADEEVLW